jgi:hypothetical protein
LIVILVATPKRLSLLVGGCSGNLVLGGKASESAENSIGIDVTAVIES